MQFVENISKSCRKVVDLFIMSHKQAACKHIIYLSMHLIDKYYDICSVLSSAEHFTGID